METGAYALDYGKDTREEYPANLVSTFFFFICSSVSGSRSRTSVDQSQVTWNMCNIATGPGARLPWNPPSPCPCENVVFVTTHLPTFWICYWLGSLRSSWPWPTFYKNGKGANGSGAALIANYKENLKGIVLNEIQEKMTVEGFCHRKNPLLLDTVAMNYNLPV